MVQNRHAGEKMMYREKTIKELTSFKIYISFVCLLPVRHSLSSMAVLSHVNDLLQRADRTVRSTRALLVNRFCCRLIDNSQNFVSLQSYSSLNKSDSCGFVQSHVHCTISGQTGLHSVLLRLWIYCAFEIMAKNTCSVALIFGHDWGDLVHLAFKGDRFNRPDRSLLRHNLNAGSI